MYHTVIIGTGMGSLTTAGLLAKSGKKCLILEQNYLAGGCTSAYWRKGFVFESGATTLVGLSENMPLQYFLAQIGVEIPAIKLDIPMQIHWENQPENTQNSLTRFQDLEAWISEAERFFGKKNQRAFWEFCFKISQFVWKTSLQQKTFPPKKISDFWHCLRNATLSQFKNAPYSLYSMDWLLKKFDLHENETFLDFVNAQLLITAQNHTSEVNVLFGATALCYTNYDNFYVEGGLINLITPIMDYIQKQGSDIQLREEVENIVYHKKEKKYEIKTNKNTYFSHNIVSGIPLNNTLQIFENAPKHLQKKVLESKKLNSAFQMGIAVKEEIAKRLPTIHHQIHLGKPLPYINAQSIFISLNHPNDHTRSDFPQHSVMSVSTHIANPAENIILDKSIIEEEIFKILTKKSFFKRENVVYYHSSTQKSWEKWTNRQYGFVGGYPQFFHIKPWDMVEARIDNIGAYLCGDTAYPGQGIVGVCLGGIIAFEKMKNDGRLSH